MATKQTVPATEEAVESDLTTLVPETEPVVIGGRTYEIGKFKLGKSLRMLRLLAQLLDEVDLARALQAESQQELISNVVRMLPRLFEEGSPILLELLALSLMPDADLSAAVKADRLKTEIANVQQMLEDEADLDIAMRVLIAGLEGVGLEALRKNVPMLLAKFR